MKDGGDIDFSIRLVKPEHSLKPLKKAEEFLRSLRSGYDFGASLTLDFKSSNGRTGRADVTGPLTQAREQSDDRIDVEFMFAPAI